MQIHKFYEEVEDDIKKLNWSKANETESNINTLLKLHKNLSYYKLVLKKYGAGHIYKIAKVINNVTAEDVKDWVKCKENDYFAFIACVAEDTGVEILKITTWLNNLTLQEGFDPNKERKAIIRLKEHLENLSNSRRALGI